MIKKLIIIFIITLYSHTAAASKLTQEQETAKKNGIILYHQYKVSAPELRIAAEAGDREAQYYLAEELRQTHQYITEEAQKWYIAAAEQGDYYAMYRLAGKGEDLCTAMNNCPADNKTAGEWLLLGQKTARALAAKGDSEAMRALYYLSNDSDWLEKAAEAGSPLAQYDLARFYRDGRLFFFPPWGRSEKAEELMKKSSEGGFIEGMDGYFAILQEKGDLAAARSLLIKMAKTGDAKAIGAYGAYLAHTPNTLDYPLDLVKGYGLMSLLLELDGGGTSKDYAEDVLPEIAAKMTPEQIEQAQAVAKEWKATHPALSYVIDKFGF